MPTAGGQLSLRLLHWPEFAGCGALGVMIRLLALMSSSSIGPSVIIDSDGPTVDPASAATLGSLRAPHPQRILDMSQGNDTLCTDTCEWSNDIAKHNFPICDDGGPGSLPSWTPVLGSHHRCELGTDCAARA